MMVRIAADGDCGVRGEAEKWKDGRKEDWKGRKRENE